MFCSLLLTKNLLHLGITFTVADLITETLFDTLKPFVVFLMKNTEAIPQTHRGVYSVLWMCSETRWPTCSLSGKSTYWPHGLLPKSNYYTHTLPLILQFIHCFCIIFIQNYESFYNTPQCHVIYSGSSFNTYLLYLLLYNTSVNIPNLIFPV